MYLLLGIKKIELYYVRSHYLTIIFEIKLIISTTIAKYYKL